jgi:hypothetical protein
MNRQALSLFTMVTLTVASFSVFASTQDTSGFSCRGGELSVASGAAFAISCMGDLYIDSSSVIRADESIVIASQGSMTLWGTLVAPRIVLTANQDMSVGGGLFSGSDNVYPEVNVLGHASSAGAVLRTFADLVTNPVVHPVYGTVSLTHVGGAPLLAPVVLPAKTADFTLELATFDLEPVAISVPEPEMYVLLGVGSLFVIGTSQRRRRAVSRSAHSC